MNVNTLRFDMFCLWSYKNRIIMTLENNSEDYQYSQDYSESFHPIKWLESVGTFLNTHSAKEDRELCPKGKKSMQMTVLTTI